MPELRKDPIVGRWVIISTERAKRPNDFVTKPENKKGGFCPFCSGNEDKTPPEILAYRDNGTSPNGPGWNIRVVSNKFPALMAEGSINRAGDGIYDKMGGIGAHEVIIETQNHELTLASMPASGVRNVLYAYKERLVDLKKDKRFRYAMIFKNNGEDAGASLEHPHSQLIALPIVPKRVLEELYGSQKYFEYKERCIFCDMIRQEIEREARIIEETDYFIAICPFAPRFPFETWIMPKIHKASFENFNDSDINSLSIILQNVLKRIDRVLNFPAYNFVVHSSPFHDSDSESFHSHIEIMPKLTKVAGFEWGTGFYINPMPPEQSAKYLREQDLTVEPRLIAT